MTIVGLDPARIEQDVRPPLDWILVRLDPPITQSEGGIIVPGQSVPPARSGVAIAVGPGFLIEDGRTVLPMHCEPGDRILFERAAGKGLPRVPRETTETRWGYLLIRNGSICATVRRGSTSPGEQRALNSGAAGLPAMAHEVDVSRCGELSWDRLDPVQDWMIVRADERLTEVDAAPGGVARPVKALHHANGTKKLLLEEKTPEERYDMWSGTALRVGRGLPVERGQFAGAVVPSFVREGDRCFFSGAPPDVQPIKELSPYAPGEAFLIRQWPCVCGVITQPVAS